MADVSVNTRRLTEKGAAQAKKTFSMAAAASKDETRQAEVRRGLERRGTRSIRHLLGADERTHRTGAEGGDINSTAAHERSDQSVSSSAVTNAKDGVTEPGCTRIRASLISTTELFVNAIAKIPA